MLITHIEDIVRKVEEIQPVQYGKTRNYIDGDVTQLSPYISRGVISTKFILSKLMNRGFQPEKIEKFIQQMAWRDYWQQVWVSKGDAINEDLRFAQQQVENYAIPKNLVAGKTGIDAIDKAIQHWYTTGLLHNHLRLYIACIACNIAKCHWKNPAKWMYYYLMDADWASNALSWQWVAGSNSHKKYIANQENINHYCHTNQQGTFLDVEYSELEKMQKPEILSEVIDLALNTKLPINKKLTIHNNLPTLLYNFYNLDPFWKKNTEANRILLLEPSHFKKYPVAENTINFMLELGKNIPGLQLYVGEFNELKQEYKLKDIFFKEHPLNSHYFGTEESRDWMFSIKGYYPSFSAFWKKCEKEMKYLY